MGFTEDELVKVYKTVVRPVASYMAEVYHSMISDEQDEMIERLQAQALKCIYGWKYSYAELRRRSGIPTLRQRRIELVDFFAKKCALSDRFSMWFPEKKAARATRAAAGGDLYKETFARCDRLRHSPVHHMRRRLNGKPGKEYGSRNRIYQDT